MLAGVREDNHRVTCQERKPPNSTLVVLDLRCGNKEEQHQKFKTDDSQSQTTTLRIVLLCRCSEDGCREVVEVYNVGKDCYNRNCGSKAHEKAPLYIKLAQSKVQSVRQIGHSSNGRLHNTLIAERECGHKDREADKDHKPLYTTLKGGVVE